MSYHVSQLTHQKCCHVPVADRDPLPPPMGCSPQAIEELWLSCPLAQTKERGGRVSACLLPAVAPAAISQGKTSHSMRGEGSCPASIWHSPCAFCGIPLVHNPQILSVFLAWYQPLCMQPIMYLFSVTNSSFFLVEHLALASLLF